MPKVSTNLSIDPQLKKAAVELFPTLALIFQLQSHSFLNSRFVFRVFHLR